MKSVHHRRKRIFILVFVSLLAVSVMAIVAVILIPKSKPAPSRQNQSTQRVAKKEVEIKKKTEPKKIISAPAPVFNKAKYSTTDPSSLWIVVNKQHPLNPKNYSPADLVASKNGFYYSSQISADLDSLITAAARQGVAFTIRSAYRSYATQGATYGGHVTSYGQATADTISARPGYSEHQTGLAVDMGSSSDPSCNLNECFGNTVEGKWLAVNATSYGFIIRYPKGSTSITGYNYEPWHVRYVGRDLAAEYKKEGASTLEQFFGISGGTAFAR